MPQRNPDYIGQALGNAFNTLGEAYANKITLDKQRAELQDLLTQLQNSKDTSYQPVGGKIQNAFGKLNPMQEVQTPRPLFSPQNIGTLTQISHVEPIALQLLAQINAANQPKLETVPQGATVGAATPTGFKPLYTNPAGFNLAPGAQRYEGRKLVAYNPFIKSSTSNIKIQPVLNPDGTPKTELIKGTNDRRIVQHYTNLDTGQDLGPAPYAAGGAPESSSAGKKQALATNQGYVVYDPLTGSISPLKDATGNQIQLGKPPTEGTVTSTSQLATLKSSLDRVKEAYTPSYVGPFVGNVSSKIQEKVLGFPTDQQGVSPQASFYSNLADIKNTLIYLKSGKQINENEYQRLSEQLPDRSLPPSTFQSRMSEFSRILDTIISSRAANLQGYGGQQGINTNPQRVDTTKTNDLSTEQLLQKLLEPE